MSKWKKKGLLPWCAVGLAAAGILTALVCLVLAAVIEKGGIPMNLAQPVSIGTAGISVLVVTAAVTKLRGRQYLATGAALGGGYGLICALLCALSGAGAAFGLWNLWLICAVMAGGMLGAIMSIGKKSHAKRRK
jgi:putative membrane protein (TIGR04086 family)